jgi:hypothetical protein
VAEFRPDEILAALDRHGVRYVLIGGLAATLHGSPYVTRDVDIVPEEAKQNLERLSDALEELHARIRVTGKPDGVPFDPAPTALARTRTWNLQTDAGDLDIAFEPSGTQGYEDLRRDAVTLQVGGTAVPVASLADVIRSKEAAGRARDHLALPGLRELLSSQRRRQRE